MQSTAADSTVADLRPGSGPDSSGFPDALADGFSDGLSVALAPLPALETLEPIWRALERDADTSFFTSWTWVGCWLAGLPDTLMVRLLHAWRGGRTVGLAVVVARPTRRFAVLPITTWHLHATGDPALDTLTIEHNGVLAERGDAAAIRTAMIEGLLRTGGRLYLPSLAPDQRDLANAAPGRIVSSHDRTACVVDLAAVRSQHSGYLGLLSSNTRTQIRRSLKAFGQFGRLTLSVADDLDTARRYLARMRELHLATWRSRGVESGSGSPFAIAFHDRLLRTGMPRGEIQLVRVDAGDTEIGYLYNFLHRGRVSYYQSGLHYGLIDTHDRPGLVAHALLVEHNARNDAAVYDFLAGDYRYKRSLSTGTEVMSDGSLEARSWHGQVEHAARGTRRRLRALNQRLRLATENDAGGLAMVGRAMSVAVVAAIAGLGADAVGTLSEQSREPLIVNVRRTRQEVEAQESSDDHPPPG